MAQCDRAAACRERSDPSYRRGFGVPSSVPKWRATVDEDGHYAFAVALWCGSLRHAAPSENAKACDYALRSVTAMRARTSSHDVPNLRSRGSPRNGGGTAI